MAAILAEPYQGAGGVIIPPAGFLTGLRKLADELGALLIVDEVQSSYGRTGPMFATDLAGVLADIMLLGKAMGNGYPVSAMIARPEVCAEVRPDQFSSSHSGNPGGCAAALAVLDAFAAEDVLGAGKRLAELFDLPVERNRRAAAGGAGTPAGARDRRGDGKCQFSRTVGVFASQPRDPAQLAHRPDGQRPAPGSGADHAA